MLQPVQTLDEAMAITGPLERQVAVTELIEKGAQVSLQFLEKVIATYDMVIIESVLNEVIKSNIKPTTTCLEIAISSRDPFTTSQRENYSLAVDPCFSIYKRQAKIVKTLIEVGVEVTSEVLDQARVDEKSLGTDKAEVALKGENLSKTSDMIESELEFIKIANVIISIQTLAEIYYQAGFFNLPPDILIFIASLTAGDNLDEVEHNEKYKDLAVTIFNSF